MSKINDLHELLYEGDPLAETDGNKITLIFEDDIEIEYVLSLFNDAIMIKPDVP